MRALLFEAAWFVLAAPAGAQSVAVPEAVLQRIPHAKIVADTSQDGRSGESRQSRTPFLIQDAVFSRAVRMTERVDVKFTAFDVQKIEVGEFLHGLYGAYCTEKSICLSDTDGDGRFDRSYVQTTIPNEIDLFNRLNHSPKWPIIPAAYEASGVPAEQRHSIGIVLYRFEKAQEGKPASAQFALVVFNPKYDFKSWRIIEGAERSVELAPDGSGMLEMMGARVQLRFTDRDRFNYTVERAMPEQPLVARIAY